MTPDESRGEFDFICSARCDKATPCLEGTCLTYDHDRYWCLPSCERAQQNDDCPPGFLCCESGEDVRTCVAPVAQTCEPL